MAFTQTDLLAIETALKSGTTRVKYSSANGSTEVEYRSLDELRRLRDQIRSELGMLEHGGITYQTVGHSKGLT